MKNFRCMMLSAALMLLSVAVSHAGERSMPDLPEVEAAYLQEVLGSQQGFLLGMDRNEMINTFIVENRTNFSARDLAMARNELASLSGDQVALILSETDFWDPTVITLVSVFAGGLGVDRFLLGQPALGVLKLVTAGGLGIWALVDMFTASGRTRAYNAREFRKAVDMSHLMLPVE